MKLRTSLPILSVLALTFACQSPEAQVTVQDTQGNYVTTSDFRKMERAEFLAAMRAGLDDFDARMADLRKRANDLGGDRLETFAECAEELQEKRTNFESELERTKAALAHDWPDRREETLDAYYDLREELDEAFEEVLES